MAQITLKVEDTLIERLGKEQIKQLFQEWLQSYKKRLALEEAADELSSINLSNDPQWQVARSLAWESYKQTFDE
jgi:hypothetical protein